MPIHLEDSSDIKIGGVIVRDSESYGISAFGCHKLAISRVKRVGFWRYNSDGIDLCNTHEVTIRNSFIRSSVALEFQSSAMPAST
jgi:polygalacturonase